MEMGKGHKEAADQVNHSNYFLFHRTHYSSFTNN